MNRSQLKILSQLASSPNNVASGLAQCIEALRLVSSLPRASPIMVEYSGMKGSFVKAFGREHLSRVPFRVSPSSGSFVLLFSSYQCFDNRLMQTVSGLLKSSMDLPSDSRITSASFYREDGTVDPTKILIDEDSWKELVPYVHTLHIEDERQAQAHSESVFATQANSVFATNAQDHSVFTTQAQTQAQTLSSASAPSQSTRSSPSPSPALTSPTRSLNCNANAFVPSKTTVTLKSTDGTKVNLRALGNGNRGRISPAGVYLFHVRSDGTTHQPVAIQPIQPLVADA